MEIRGEICCAEKERHGLLWVELGQNAGSSNLGQLLNVVALGEKIQGFPAFILVFVERIHVYHLWFGVIEELSCVHESEE